MSGLQTPEDVASANILKNLHFLEQFTGDSEDQSGDSDIVGQTVRETAEWTYQTIFSEEVEIGLQILDLLVFLDSVGLDEPKKLRFEKLFGNRIVKIVVHYNSAVCHQM